MAKTAKNYTTVRGAMNYLARLIEPDGRKTEEPIFVLRGQDRLAAATVYFWAQMAEENGVAVKKVEGAREHARAMRRWPRKKLPD